MSKEVNNDSALDRYLALKAIRENIYNQRPVRYNLLDFADDIPGAGRGVGMWHSDVLPSLGVISRNPEVRKQQITQAAKKIRDSRADLKSTGKQIVGNALGMGLSAAPVSAVISSLFRLLGPRSPMSAGKFRSPFTISRNIDKLKNSNIYRQRFLKETLDDAAKGGLFGAASGTVPPIISSISKPPDTSIAAAENILQDFPYSSGLPAGDIVSVLDGKKSKLKNILLGTGIGGAMGAAGAFLPASLNIPKRLLVGAIKTKLPFKDIAKDFSRSSRKNLLLNSALVGGSGGLAGYLLSKNE